MRLLRVGISVAASASVLGTLVAPGIIGTASATATTMITLWQNGPITGPGSGASYLPAEVASYEADNPGVKVQLIPEPASNYFALLQSSFISRTAPDIVDLFAGSYNLPIEPYLTDLKTYIPASVLDAAKGTEYYAVNDSMKNSIFGAPIADQFYNGFYNKALFGKAGIMSAPTDWSQLFADCATLKSHGITPIAYSMSSGGAHETWSYLASALPLGEWNNLLDDKLSYNNPTLSYQLEQWSLLYKDHYTNPDPVTSTDASAQFAAGKVAMYIDGSWDIPTFAALGSNLGVMVTPFSKVPQTTIIEMPGGGYGIPKTANDPTLAAKFLTFLMSQKGQQIVANSGQPPVISKGVVETNGALKELLAQAGSGKYTKYPMFDNFAEPSVATGITNEMELAFAGQTSAQSALINLEKTQAALPASQRDIDYGL